MQPVSVFVFWLFFFFNIYLLGCIGSELGQAGSFLAAHRLQLYHAGSVVTGRGLTCLPCTWDHSPTRDGTNVPCIAWWILNLWTTREVLVQPTLDRSCTKLCCICQKRPFGITSFFFFFIYSYQLEANYFTVLQWVLSYIDMNQPWVYMYSPIACRQVSIVIES